MTGIETYIVDSFTDEPFKGNPAGVCLIKRAISDEKMLSIAQELGLSETAFVHLQSGQEKIPIRYFSPKMEIPLCGHATLAAAKVLFQNDLGITKIHFVNTQDLDLTIRKDGAFIIMEFPIYGTEPRTAPEALLVALGIDEIKNSAYNEETKILLLEINDCKVLQGLQPDFEKLKRSIDSINGVLVTALSDKPDYDFESRYFWPWSGTNEDPVTGGTHTFLAKYWGDRLGKRKMNSFQCSERTGFMEVELIDQHKMTIKGKAQIVLKGELTI
ncbi:PhzF family phenazine biosynthesis protein [Flavilitoribacter nigricans]|uniref:Phenazine biosynthesis protein PhzF n=1 Tax=Flavilitoribacter nigricans (strain ATCC 23147 / DSM 23189 / NBRC 102662 / NCIMB 1420 / SS-2) TaxID=1122177 RepID=A0A2D0N6T0_FLAN2|nr:PhzF family phenazine biosynthesis protein [Flavilitoribacter nigricans]PHN04195.1 phenazine biosynthesis protein PhzF [Flavilitoribacter nigricans DSM 23189 = NBRC 102662]